MRYRLFILVPVLALLSLGVQLIVNKPYRAFDQQPAGWSSSRASTDLAGASATMAVLTAPTGLSSNDYARVMYYASKAYMGTRYPKSPGATDATNGSPEDAVASFYEVLRSLVPDAELAKSLPPYQMSDQGRVVVAATLDVAQRDGYANWPAEVIDELSPLQLGVDRRDYSWRPPLGNGPELENTWGELVSPLDHTCSTPAPPLRTYQDLLDASARSRTAREAFAADSNYSKIMSLGLEYMGGFRLRGDPPRLMFQVLTNAALDNNLSQRETDALISQAALAIHATMIATWKAKYQYLLAHPFSFNKDVLPYAIPHSPSYPSEFTSVPQAAMTVLSKYLPNARPRMEFAGSQIAAPTTRVLPSATDLVTEAGTLAQIFGLAYDFDATAGALLGACIADAAAEESV